MASLKLSPDNKSIHSSAKKYIDDISPDLRSKLCTEIDYTIHRNEGYWQKLIDRLGFDETHSKKFRLSFEMRGSPTENLLRDCSYRMLRIRHLYQILNEIGLVHLAKDYLGEYDTEEPLPPCPTPFSIQKAFSSLRKYDSLHEHQYFDIPTEKGQKSLKGDPWLGIDTFHFSYKEIQEGTQNFSYTMELGAGAFGKVYKVYLNNTLFACKVLKIDKGNQLTTSLIETHRQHDDLRNELNYLAEYRHPNVIALYGWSLDGPDPCLIYDYMKNGSLQDRLQCLNGSKPMDWEIRVKVSCGAARGLQFLHTMKSKPLIHGDIKTANILLDDSFTAKLGDFGLARELPRNPTTGSYIRLENEHTPGTLGYLANEYITMRKLSVEVDTYAFGVVLLELYTGRRAYESSKKIPLRDYMDDVACEDKADEKLFHLQDPQIMKLEENAALKFVRLALACCHERRKERPKMSKTLTELTEINRMVARANGKEPEDSDQPHNDRLNVPPSGVHLSPRHQYGYTKTRDPTETNAPRQRRNPVESVDNSLIIGDNMASFAESHIRRRSSKQSLSSVEKHLDQMKLNSSDDSDSTGRSSNDTTHSGMYFISDKPSKPSAVSGQPQYGYYHPPNGFSGSPALNPPPPQINVGNNLYGYINGRSPIRPPNNQTNDLYGPGPYSCPAGHRVFENPYKLNLTNVPRPPPCTCPSCNMSQQPNVSPLHTQSQWPGAVDCSPETFTSFDYKGPSCIHNAGRLAHTPTINVDDPSPSDLACQPGPSNIPDLASPRLPYVGASTPVIPQRPKSFNIQLSNCSESDAGYPDSFNLSSESGLSVNPVKESLVDKLRDGLSYTQIFPDRKRIPTEGMTNESVS